MTKTNSLRTLVMLPAMALTVLLALVVINPAKAALPGTNGRIAFVSNRTTGADVENPEGDYEVFTMNPDGTGLNQVTTNTTDEYTVAISPDGTKIAYESCDTTYIICDIYETNADGSGTPTQLTNNPADDAGPQWSPDSQQIVFTSYRDNNAEVYVMDAVDSDGDGNGDNPTNLTNSSADDFGADFSPDGTKMAFVSDRDGDSEIYVMNAAPESLTNQPTQLTNNPYVDGVNESQPDWSPDGAKIAFSSRSSEGGANHIFVMDAVDSDGDGNGDNRTPLAVNGDIDEEPAFSPDGTKIAFYSNPDRYSLGGEVYVMDAVDSDGDGNGDNPTNLTNNPASDGSPSWGPAVVDNIAPQAPVISNPANNSYDTDGNLTVSGTAEAASTVKLFEESSSEPVDTTTADASGNWSITLTGTAEGSYTYTATASDAAGNTSGTSNSVRVIVDKTAPTVPSVTPDSDATDVLRSTNVTATFSEEVDQKTITNNVTLVSKKGKTPSPVPAAITLSSTADGKTVVTLDPSVTLAKRTQYEARIKGGTGGVKDLAGNPLAADKVWSFTTGTK